MLEKKEEFLEYLVNNIGVTDIKDIVSRLNNIERYLLDKDFCLDSCSRFLVSMQKEGKANNTINRHISVLRKLCDFYENISYYDLKELKRIKELKYKKKINLVDREILTETEIRKVANVTINYKNGSYDLNKKHNNIINNRIKTAIYILALGLRIGELCNIQWDDVKNDHINIREGKSINAVRKVYITPRLHKMIIKLERYSHNYVFGSKRGKMDKQYFNDELKKRLLKVGITKNITAHCFRHSFITQSIEKGCSIAYIKEHVGHASFSTTEQYTHLSLKHTKQVVESHSLFRNKSADNIKDLIGSKLDLIHDKEKLKAILTIISS